MVGAAVGVVVLMAFQFKGQPATPADPVPSLQQSASSYNHQPGYPPAAVPSTQPPTASNLPPIKKHNRRSGSCGAFAQELAPMALNGEVVEPGSTVRSQNGSSGTFNWEDIEAGSKATCGFSKCFIQSATNKDAGYLVAVCGVSAGHLRSDVLCKTEDTAFIWMYSNCLANRYGIKHLMLAPEEHVAVSTSIASRLQSVHAAQSLEMFQVPRFARKRSILSSVRPGEQLVVQTVQTAPQPSLLVGCWADKWQSTLAGLAAFTSAVRVTTVFVSHLNSSLEPTRKLLLNEDCLTVDLQFFISDEGDVIHLDLDRGLINCKQRPEQYIGSAQWGLDCLQQLVSRFVDIVKTELIR